MFTESKNTFTLIYVFQTLYKLAHSMSVNGLVKNVIIECGDILHIYQYQDVKLSIHCICTSHLF